MAALTKLDILQVRAFHAAYKLGHDLPREERLLTAICQTSDDMFAKADKTKVEQWLQGYGNRVYRYNKVPLGRDGRSKAMNEEIEKSDE